MPKTKTSLPIREALAKLLRGKGVTLARGSWAALNDDTSFPDTFEEACEEIEFDGEEFDDDEDIDDEVLKRKACKFIGKILDKEKPLWAFYAPGTDAGPFGSTGSFEFKVATKKFNVIEYAEGPCDMNFA